MSGCHPDELKWLEDCLSLDWSYILLKVCESWPYIYQKTRKQTNRKWIKGTTKINFPICKMSHTHLNGVRYKS